MKRAHRSVAADTVRLPAGPTLRQGETAGSGARQSRQTLRRRMRQVAGRLTSRSGVRGIRSAGPSQRDKATAVREFRTGAASAMRLVLTPFGRHAARFHLKCQSSARAGLGLAVVLPGIDGCTTVCDGIVRGLVQGGWKAAIEVHDWRSFRGWNPLHLATARSNHERAREIAGSIQRFLADYPGRPVHLIGHSAGAGMALFVLQHLSAGIKVQSVVLLAAAVSRQFEIASLLPRTRNGIWSFWSRADLPATGLGTMIFGTMDRRHTVSAGALGFKVPAGGRTSQEQTCLHQVGYRFRMARVWNFGGHFGCTNAAFIARYVAPVVQDRVTSVSQLLDQV